MTGLPKAVMLFAAGFGTRMGALTKDRPKPLIPVAGRALIDHTLTLAREIAPDRIVANTHYKPDQMQRHLQPLGVAISSEQPEILETGGGLKAALPLLGSGPVFAMNTDAIWIGPNPLRLLRDAWRPDEMDALLMCVPVASAFGYDGVGDFTCDQGGRIHRGAGLVYGGAQILKTDGLASIPQKAFSLNLFWDAMMEKGRLRTLSYPGRWCDVGHPAGLELAEDLLKDANV
ncbi:nucleotidyltransferase family protein [Sedimentitalea sp. JM2-8]|uniref:Nucleotidyltransferase family protein n=1 Tax=Sedimentitalea xiamensis TaxID=3050037 RepID=A0ABT7F9K6_9RHOB|nr:nucleotidyltransferase family protein [Sedimentitalea xiamensis]MDK3071797.1 nucleotidyltransferase family protein [Sedimentitalea xiamensis]